MSTKIIITTTGRKRKKKSDLRLVVGLTLYARHVKRTTSSGTNFAMKLRPVVSIRTSSPRLIFLSWSDRRSVHLREDGVVILTALVQQNKQR